jgi:hypothetical protein
VYIYIYTEPLSHRATEPQTDGQTDRQREREREEREERREKREERVRRRVRVGAGVGDVYLTKNTPRLSSCPTGSAEHPEPFIQFIPISPVFTRLRLGKSQVAATIG